MAPLLLYQLVTIFVLTPSSQHLAQGTTLDIITPRQQSATAGTSADDCDIFIDIGSQFLSSSGECVHVNQHYNYTTWNCLSSFTFPDHTCIRIHQDLTYTQLGFVINFVNITGVRITSVPATTNGAGQEEAATKQKFKIVCVGDTNEKSGFHFENVKSVFITSLEFLNCGHPRPSNVLLPAYDAAPIYSWSAVSFNNSRDIFMENVSFNQSHGYGTTFFNCQGNLNFSQLVYRDNIQMDHYLRSTHKLIKGLASGGGIYMEYNQPTTSKTSISISHSHFINNKGENVSINPKGLGMAESHIGFGRGGAVALFLLNSSISDLTLDVSDCEFNSNTAAWGGAVYTRFLGESSSNTVSIRRSFFNKNNATLSGGALFVASTQIADFKNTVHLTGCWFDSNEAKVGGAIGYKWIAAIDFGKRSCSSIRDTNFTRNVAQVGFALNVELVSIDFSNVQLIHQKSSIASGLAALYAFKSRLWFEGEALIELNQQNALMLDCSDLYIQGVVLFSDNIGENGGALALYGSSHLYVFNTTDLKFSSNRAWRRGGAIYAELSGPSMNHSIVLALRFDECFIQFGDGNDVGGGDFAQAVATFNGSVTFVNNSAAINGDSIFVTSLAACVTSSTGINGTITSWRNFSFQPNNSQITTRTTRILVKDYQWNQIPGKQFTTDVVLLDQLDNHVSEQINVDIQSHPECNVQVATNPRFIVTENDTISLMLLGNNQPGSPDHPEQKCCFDVIISLAWNNFTSYHMRGRCLKPCSFGYTFVKDSCHCKLGKNQAKGIAFCRRGDVYLYKNRWASPNQTAFYKDEETTVVCPPGYCKNCNSTDEQKLGGNVCKFEQENPKQCIDSRDQSSRICGSCKPGWSVVLGSEKCVRCDGPGKYNGIWISVCLIILFIGIDVALIWLDIDIYSCYLNGFLYFCQTLVLLPPSSFRLWEPLNIITGSLNMESTGGNLPAFCFIPGLDNLSKQLINYLFPTLMLSILGVFGLLAQRPGSFFARTNKIKAFTIISVIAYADYTRITFLLMNKSKIDPDDTHEYVWIHGETKYLGPEHVKYFSLAIVFLVFIVIGFPLVLVLSSRLVAWNISWNPFRRIVIFFNNFTYCYRRGCYSFSAFYFFVRVIFQSIHTFSKASPFQSTIKCLLCIVVCVVFTFVQPYRDPWMNYFDSFVLANLTVISLLSLVMSGFPFQIRQVFNVIINILALIPLLLVATKLLRIYLPRIMNWIQAKYTSWKNNRDDANLRPLLFPTESELEGDYGDDDEIENDGERKEEDLNDSVEM